MVPRPTTPTQHTQLLIQKIRAAAAAADPCGEEEEGDCSAAMVVAGELAPMQGGGGKEGRERENKPHPPQKEP